ncbi:MAG: CinA family protein [Clostridia bacterium]|nr:CinA family protein [Clostridia bacterium]
MNENNFIEVRQEDITIDQSPESERRLCAEIIEALTNDGKHITFAESCTGGMLAEMLTAVSGASECFDGSFVTYANEQKEKLIGVRHETLAKYGAVSYQTALEMSRGARLALGADIGAGVTGIAGPGGGTPEKPVGLVYISISTKDIHCFCRLNLDGDRFEVRRKTCLYVLELVKRMAV